MNIKIWFLIETICSPESSLCFLFSTGPEPLIFTWHMDFWSKDLIFLLACHWTWPRGPQVDMTSGTWAAIWDCAVAVACWRWWRTRADSTWAPSSRLAVPDLAQRPPVFFFFGWMERNKLFCLINLFLATGCRSLVRVQGYWS